MAWVYHAEWISAFISAAACKLMLFCCMVWHGDCKSFMYISVTNLHRLTVNGPKNCVQWIMHLTPACLNEAKFPSVFSAKIGT